jgi:hypothetical protein
MKRLGDLVIDMKRREKVVQSSPSNMFHAVSVIE